MTAAPGRRRSTLLRIAWWSVAVIVGGLAAAPSASAAPRGPDLVLDTPSTAVAGVPFDVTVTVRKAGRHSPPYVGTVRFASDDTLARALPAEYTFTAADRGRHTFTGVTLVGTGSHRLTVQDTGNHRLRDRDRVRVRNAGAAIEGQVLSSMDPVAGGTVTVYDAVTGLALASGPADINENYYRITGLPAGAVKLGAVVPGPYAPDFANDRDTLAQADVFLLSPGVTLVQSWDAEPWGPYLDVQRIG